MKTSRLSRNLLAIVLLPAIVFAGLQGSRCMCAANNEGEARHECCAGAVRNANHGLADECQPARGRPGPDSPDGCGCKVVDLIAVTNAPATGMLEAGGSLLLDWIVLLPLPDGELEGVHLNCGLSRGPPGDEHAPPLFLLQRNLRC